MEVDIDLALLAAQHGDLPHALDALQAAAQHLVGVLGGIADAPRRGEGEFQDRHGVRIYLVYHWGLDVEGQIGQNTVDLVADLLDGDIDVLLQLERNDDLRDAIVGVGVQLVDAADGIDRLLDLVHDIGLDLLRRRSVLTHHNGNDGEIHLGEAIHSQPEVAEGPDNDQSQNQNGRKDGPPHTDIR